MKVIFIISSIRKTNEGIGGHYYSLLETTKQISKKHKVIVINIGVKPAKSLVGCPHKVYSVIHQGPALLAIYKDVKAIIEEEKPDVLHSFDHIAHYWARLVGARLKIPICLTKCGGVNPIYFSYTKNLILYSQENLKFFSQKKKFIDSNFYLIPNRIAEFDDDWEAINRIEDGIGHYRNTFKFLRITRIGDTYLKSSLQLISLVNQLTKDGVACCLIFVGVVESDECFLQLKQAAGDNCFFITDSEYTQNAKRLINVADAVLGTGRGFMEAASKSKIMLCPNQHSQNPVLVNEHTFDEAFAFNFSERIKISGFDEQKNVEEIKNIINLAAEKNKLQIFSRKLFEEYFDISEVVEKYDAIYEMLTIEPIRLFDLFLYTLFVIRKYYRQ